MVEHEPLHLSVVGATPMRARQKRPADLDLALLGVESKVPRRAYGPLRLPVYDDKRSPRIQCSLKELFEDALFPPIIGGVLLPYHGIGGDQKQVVPIFL